MDTSHLLVRMKQFVKSSENSSSFSVLNNKRKEPPMVVPISGSQVKRFYENTVGSEAFEKLQKTEIKRRTISQKKCKSNSNANKVPVDVNTLMKAIENNDTKTVKKILEERKEIINCQDQFGWTPLMAACCAGNRLMVKLILQWRPDLSLCDKRGNSCQDLAAAKGHHCIKQLLKQYKHDIHKPSSSGEEKVVNTSSRLSLDIPVFYCEVCKQEIKNTTFQQHLASTIHNFNAASKRRMPTMYGIPESNKGFQILLRSGWDKEQGLGPTGDGHKFPPKTILKQDRTGLGANQYKAKVTHTLEDSRRDAKPKNTLKRELKYDKIKKQRQERNLRNMLS